MFEKEVNSLTNEEMLEIIKEVLWEQEGFAYWELIYNKLESIVKEVPYLKEKINNLKVNILEIEMDRRELNRKLAQKEF